MNQPRLVCRLLVVFISLISGMNAEAQTWRDKLRNKAQDAKRQWQESERRCADCGKVIHGRDRCTTCEARRVAERARSAKENIQERWQQAERRCSVCGKVIHGRATCLECEARRLGTQGRDVARTAADASRQLRETWHANKDRWRADARAAIDTSARRCTEIIRDPQKRLEYAKKAVAVGLAVELTVIRNVPVMDPDSGRIVSVDTLMRKMASDSGIGGSMGEDPVGTAFLIMVDSDYLFSGARLIPAPDGEYVTLDEALRVSREVPGLMNDAAIGSAGMARSRMQYACRVGDSATFRQASAEFASAIDSINGSHSSPTAARHLLFWGSMDGGILAVASFFQESYQSLSRALTSAGLDQELSSWTATVILGLACFVAFLLVRAMMRARLKSRLRRAEAEVLELRAQAERPDRA